MRGRQRRRRSFVRLGTILLLPAAAAIAGVTIWKLEQSEERTGVRPVQEALARTAIPRPATQTHRLHRARARRVDLYAHDGVGMIQPDARRALYRVYVPNSAANSVDVIDPQTFKIVDHFDVGALPQHITPSHDLKTLYVNNDVGNSLTPIDPLTARPGRPIPVDDPYNLYFTPNGRYAIVVAERLHRLDFRSARTLKLIRRLTVPCAGVNHLDFSANGRYAIASCEFSGRLLKVDVVHFRVLGARTLPRRFSVPQDVRSSPNANVFYVADLAAGGVWEVNPRRLEIIGFIRTGAGAHGLVVSRNGKALYVANRNAGTVSVVSFRKRKVLRTWRIRGSASPDMGDVSPDGRVLWLSGRYNAEVYALSTRTGRLLARIPVGASPHGLCVWPQPGRYSIGHTGNMR